MGFRMVLARPLYCFRLLSNLCECTRKYGKFRIFYNAKTSTGTGVYSYSVTMAHRYVTQAATSALASINFRRNQMFNSESKPVLAIGSSYWSD